MKKLPKARTTEIVENEIDKELLIYDLKTDKIYSLNETSKIVFKACDGRQTFEDLKRRYKFTDDLIYFALNELETHGLIDNFASDHFSGLTRREIISRVGLATMIALPVIAGIAAPTASHAASRVVCRGTPCSCTVPNTRNDDVIQLCELQLRGVQTGCPSNIIGCECSVIRGGNTGFCDVFTV